MATAGHIEKVVEQERLTLQEMEADPQTFSKLDRGALKAFLAYHEGILEALTEGRKIAFYTLGHSPEIFWAMDIQPVEPSALAVGVEEKSMLEDIDLIENQWLLSTTCGFPKIVVGAIAAGKLPPVDLLIGGGHPCDPMTAAFHAIPEMVKAPIFYFDVPRWNDERSLEYVAAELKRMISFLEEQTGKKLDIDRLREVAEESNKGEELYVEANELRKAVPCPQPGGVLTLAHLVRRFLQGSPVATSFFREIVDDTTERVKRGEGAVPEEKIRVLWYDVGGGGERYKWMEREWGAVAVMDLDSYQPASYIDTSTYDSMLRGLADRIFQHNMVRSFHRGLVDNYIDEFVRVYEDYRADCALILGHNMDKQRGVLRSLLKEICREKGIPLLIMDFDTFDTRTVSEGTILNNIERFFTTIVLR